MQRKKEVSCLDLRSSFDHLNEETTELTMQSVLDSLCRCLGTNGPQPNETDDHVMDTHMDTSSGSPSAHSRKLNRLELQDKQWDALFDNQRGGTSSSRRQQQQQTQQQQRPAGSPRSNKSDSSNNNNMSDDNRNPSALEQAHALAKAKLAANPSRYKAHKRKRSLKSRDDIFRQRRQSFELGPEPTTGCGVGGGGANAAGAGAGARDGAERTSAVSRLVNHPVVVNALCFATPINEDFDNHSLTSDTNTLNTCEDTINSMFYLETTQLANVVEKRPPMPLFSQFQVKDSSISKIIATDSHSSLKMLYENPAAATTTAPMMTTSVPALPRKPSNSQNPQNQYHPQQRQRQHHQQHQQRQLQQRPQHRQVPLTVSSSEEDIPPQVTPSSGSSSSSRRV